MPSEKPETIVITNFGGRLTRIINGELNSGFAKFTTSFGYDPFSKPMNLTWLEQPVDITGPTSDGLIVAAKPRPTTAMTVYAISSAAKMFTITSASVLAGSPNVDSVVGIASLTAGSPTFLYGSSMDFFGSTEKIYYSADNRMNSINFDGSGDATLGSNNMAPNTYHPVKQFSGKLLFGNGNTVAAVDATGTITSSVVGTGQGSYYSELNPPLGVESYVHDLDSSVDGNYSLITASNVNNEQILTPTSDGFESSANDGYLFRWNGSDPTITAFSTIPSYSVSALQTYLQRNMFFSNDSFGSSLNDGTNKILTLPNNKAPLPNATAVNGNFMTWICPEVSSDGSTRNASLYYFGQLDQENPIGLYRMMRLASPLAGGFVYQTPLNILVANRYSTVNSAKTAIAAQSYGKHYLSVMAIKAATGNSYTLYRFLVTPSGTGTPQLGVYETQTQLFSKRIAIAQIRVYTEPTIAGNGFKLDILGGDGSVIENGTFNYTFAAGSSPLALQGSFERINFSPNSQTLYSFALRITNTGTTNMTIKKIEIDYTPEGK